MPSPTRQQRKRQQTRDRLADVAFGLFEDHGFEAVAMEQIARVADVARGTLYNHFPAKEAVLVHAMHAQLQRDLAPLLHDVMLRTGFTCRANAVLEASAAWWEPRRGYLEPYVRYRFQHIGKASQKDGGTASDMLPPWTGLIECAQRDGELRQDIGAPQLAYYLHFLYLSVLMHWLADPALSLQDGMANALEFFHQGARTGQAAVAG